MRRFLQRVAPATAAGLVTVACGALLLRPKSQCLLPDNTKTNNAEDEYAERRMRNLTLLCGNAHPSLGNEVSELLGVPLSGSRINRFADGECSIKIQSSVRGRDVYIIQPTCAPINDNLIELLLMTSTCRRASARSITVVIPYFGYSRQDRKRQGRETIAAADVARMLETSGVDRVISVDLHRGQMEGFFETRTTVDNLDSMAVAVPYMMSKNLIDPVVLCPSATGVHRAKIFRDLLKIEGMDCGLAFIAPQDMGGALDPEIGHHHRVSDTISPLVVGEVQNSDVIIVDDMIDTGSRVVTAAKVCKSQGARRVFAFATHGLFSGDAQQVLHNSPITEVVVTNTVPIDHLSSKITTTSIAPLVAEAIRRAHLNKTLSVLTHRNPR